MAMANILTSLERTADGRLAMVIHEKNERELQKSMSSKDLRAEDITGSGSYIGAIYQEEVDEGGKFKKKKKKRTTKKDKGGIAREN